MRYQRVGWRHDSDEEPVVLYSEVDDQGNEVRKVEEYRSGRLDLASDDRQTGNTFLSEGVLPSLDDTNRDPELEGKSISKEEFEVVWEKAWRWFVDADDPS